jgi:XRE family transcriptional regulator, regulator of sulfur utilization
LDELMRVAFGGVLRRLRTERGVSQEWLGLHAALQRKHISRLELGEMQPSLATVFKIATALHISPSTFVSMVECELRLTNGGISVGRKHRER